MHGAAANGLEATVAVTVGTKKLFATNATGHLFERRKVRSSLQWLHVSPPAPYGLATPPLKSPSGEVSCFIYFSYCCMTEYFTNLISYNLMIKKSVWVIGLCGELLERESFRVNVSRSSKNSPSSSPTAKKKKSKSETLKAAAKKKKASKKRAQTRVVDRWYSHGRPTGPHCLSAVVNIAELSQRGKGKDKGKGKKRASGFVLATDRAGALHQLDTRRSKVRVLVFIFHRMTEYLTNLKLLLMIIF